MNLRSGFVRGGSLLSDTLTVATFTTITKLAGAAKVVLSARFFGPGSDLDAYLLAFLVPSFLADVLAGALGPALIPVLVEAREVGSRELALEAYADALHRSFGALSAGAVLLAFCAFAIDPAWVGIHLANVRLARTMLLIMAPMLPITAVAGVWRSVLNAQLRFSAAAVSPAVTPLVTIAFLAGAKRHGVIVLALGSTMGILTELAILAFALRAAGFPVLPRRGRRTLGRGTSREYGAIAASNLVMRGSTLIDQTAAAMLGAGNLSIWNFGTRLVVVLLAVGPAALSTAVLPRFSQMAAVKTWRRLRSSLTLPVLVSMAAMGVIVAVAIAFSGTIVRVAFERGAFTPEDARRVAWVQSCSLLQAPFAVGLAILTRFVASLKVNSVLLPIATASLLLNAVLDFVLMRNYGVAGIALSATGVQIFLFASVAYVVFRRLAAREPEAAVAV